MNNYHEMLREGELRRPGPDCENCNVENMFHWRGRFFSGIPVRIAKRKKF